MNMPDAAIEAAKEAALAEAWEVGFQKGIEFSHWAGEIDIAKPDYTNPFRSQL